jgi:hypothetical protein
MTRLSLLIVITCVSLYSSVFLCIPLCFSVPSYFSGYPCSYYLVAISMYFIFTISGKSHAKINSNEH